MALFGKQNLHTAQDIMDTILTTGQIKEKEGAVEIQRKEGRKVIQSGILYFRKELVYAAHVDEMPVPIYRRLVTGKKIADPTELSAILRNVGGDESSPDIVRRVLVNHLLSEKTLDAYVKEHFLDHVAEILSWETCVGTWMDGVTTKDFTMPNVSFRQLKAIVAKRNSRYRELVEETSRFFAEEELLQVTPVSTTRNLGSMQPEVKSILSLSAGTNTIVDIAQETGLGRGSTFQMVQALWRNGNLSLRLGEITVAYKDVLEANKPDVHDDAPILETPVIELEVPADELENQIHESPLKETPRDVPVESEQEDNFMESALEDTEDNDAKAAEGSLDAFIEQVDIDEPEEEVEMAVEDDQEDVPLIHSEGNQIDFTEDVEPSDEGENPTEDVEARMDRMYAELGIERIEYDESDSMDIDPISVDLHVSDEKDEPVHPLPESDLSEPEPIEDSGQEFEPTSFSGEEDVIAPIQTEAGESSEDTSFDVEIGNIDSFEYEESGDVENAPEDGLSDSTEEEVSVDDVTSEEVAVDENQSESDNSGSDDSIEVGPGADGVSEAPNPEDEILTDDSPITTLPQLMERLEALKSFGEGLENEITVANQIAEDTDTEESEARATLESARAEVDELDKKADELRSQYEAVIEQIEVAYRNQVQLEESAQEAANKAHEAKNRSEELTSRKERVLDAIEKAAHSFSAR